MQESFFPSSSASSGASGASASNLRARSMALALVMGLTLAVTGLMALIAGWMYWIVPSLLR